MSNLLETLDVEAVRRELPVTRRTAYLNTGTAGPWPRPVVDAVRVALERETELGRASPRGLPDFPEVLAQTRAQMASWVGAEPDSLALTGSTTEGVNIAVWGLDWRPGDQVVTTSIEHFGVLAPLQQLALRREVRVRVAEVGDGADALAAIQQTITPRTRLVAVSHVSYSTGACLPIRAIADAAHAAGAALLVDGAQAVGALAVDVNALDVDYYAFPGQKWLLGPEGSGGLYIKPARQAELQATFAGTRNVRPGAAGLEYRMLFRPGIHGLHAGLTWLEFLGRAAIFARVRELADYCYACVSAVPGAELLTPASARAGLVHVQLPGRDLDACVASLAEAGVTVRSVADTASLRIRTRRVSMRAEADRLAAVLSLRQ